MKTLNLVLTLREEITCLILLVFLLMNSKLYKIGEKGGFFKRLSSYALCHVILDIITVYTVNHLEIVPGWMNKLLHALFYLSAILFTREFFCYTLELVKAGKYKHILQKASMAFPLVYLLCLPFLPIVYLKGNGTNYSFGMAAYVGYAIAFFFQVAGIVVVLIRYRQVETHIKYTLIPMSMLAAATEIVQILVPEFLFTGSCMTLITLGIFFSLENPVMVFRRKATIDALTGLKSRNSYEIDIEQMKQDYAQGKYETRQIGFVFCDLNGLKLVNDTQGHLVGDEYIGLVTHALKTELRSAKEIYRMGGDEFLAVYIGSRTEDIEKEIGNVHAVCKQLSRETPFNVEVAIGYAQTGKGTVSLKDVLRSADHAMYENKWRMKNPEADPLPQEGCRLDRTGLTDRIFEAFAGASDRQYIYLSNIRTNVSRWSRAAVEYFGLPGEYMLDMETIWEEYIHPEDRGMFRTDITAVLSGKKEQHDMEYRVRNKDGKYVVCTCQGKVLKGQKGQPDLFAGTIVNHGVVDGIDPVTNLHNSHEMQAYLHHALMQREKMAVLKVEIQAFDRVNMTYGTVCGNEVLRLFAIRLKKLVNYHGTVFRIEGAEFVLCLPGWDSEDIRKLFGHIRQIAEKEIRLDALVIPLRVSAGALILEDFSVDEYRVKSRLDYALEQSRAERHGELAFFDDTVKGGDQKRLELYAEVNQSVLDGCKGFYLNYQPVKSLADGSFVGMEALVRWRDSKGQEVLPGDFIPWLEDEPSFYELGKWIFRTAFQDAWPLMEKYPHFHLYVNLTPGQLKHHNFQADLLQILQECDYPPDALCLELTERCRNLSAKMLKESLDNLRELGIQTAVDDIGIGAFTSGLLLEAPFDLLKIDRSFIKDIAHQPSKQILVNHIVDVARELKIKTCLEGVEDQETYECVKALFPTYYQGFYYSKPKAIEEIIERWG